MCQLCSRYLKDTYKHPNPYLMLGNSLIEDASLKYFVGQEISEMKCFWFNI